eukprot:16435309-Heterocapsa_arctica.AAC.1
MNEVIKEVVQEFVKEPAELQALQQLTIGGCPDLAALPAEMGQLQALLQLTISRCPAAQLSLAALPAELQALAL